MDIVKKFVIADPHFYDKNIKLYENRKITDDKMISLWNETVGPQDIIYILGDFANGNLETIKNLVSQLNGYKILIKGNHDGFLNQINWRDYFDKVCDYLKIKDNGRDVVLMHYPIEEWDGFFRGSYHLYGHVHNNDNGLRKIEKRYNVGVDVNDFEPKTLDELIERNK